MLAPGPRASIQVLPTTPQGFKRGPTGTIRDNGLSMLDGVLTGKPSPIGRNLLAPQKILIILSRSKGQKTKQNKSQTVIWAPFPSPP